MRTEIGGRSHRAEVRAAWLIATLAEFLFGDEDGSFSST